MVILIPSFHDSEILLTGSLLLKIKVHITGTPVSERNGRTVKLMSVVERLGAASGSPFGRIKVSPQHANH
jgi:hypothetical protein